MRKDGGSDSMAAESCDPGRGPAARTSAVPRTASKPRCATPLAKDARETAANERLLPGAPPRCASTSVAESQANVAWRWLPGRATRGGPCCCRCCCASKCSALVEWRSCPSSPRAQPPSTMEKTTSAMVIGNTMRQQINPRLPPKPADSTRLSVATREKPETPPAAVAVGLAVGLTSLASSGNPAEATATTTGKSNTCVNTEIAKTTAPLGIRASDKRPRSHSDSSCRGVQSSDAENGKRDRAGNVKRRLAESQL
mmetsp:Transcript_130823/g.279876  ORF Transcript_130823/g.279876 Transcript_130823/m.279876 type:complete len:255 (+) Transcript_130823:738-1502(+)